MPKSSKKNSYTADDIQVLEGLEPVRKRPGMYIGSTGPSGLHHLIKEIFDNSRDEAMAGYCDHIEITLLPNGKVRVADNGRGIPVGKHKKTGVSALETIMTTLHAGGKFTSTGGYSVSGGLHGVGASVVNALSTWARVEVHQDGNKYYQEYKTGIKQNEVKKFGKSNRTGTIVTYIPDDTIFSEIKYNWQQIVSHYRNQAYLVKNLRIVIVDAREYPKEIDDQSTYYIRDLSLPLPSVTYFFEGGLVSMVRHHNKNFKTIHDNIFHVEKDYEDINVEVALQYVEDISNRILGFANNISTPGGGMHITGFKSALTRLINNYNKKNKVISEKEGSFSGDDLLEGVTVVVSVKMSADKIQFEGQTKDKLGTPDARSAVESIFAEAFDYYLEENPDDAKNIIKKAVLAMRARKAAKAAKDSILRKGALDGMTLPGKLADCQTRKAEDAEIFIVEGDSAGGTAKQGRDRKTQAILPLRGKILNVERSRLDKIVSNKEIKSLIIALGTSIGDTFNIDKLRYQKIILANDADVDGSHITTLALTLFYRYFKELIEAGYVYIAMPPLYKIEHGKKIFYVYNDEEKEKTLKKLGVEVTEDDEVVEDEDSPKKKSKKVNIQRYKGLGEMNADELWETTMDPANRILKQVTIEDAEIADKTFDVLMGTDVPSRKAFIQSHAKTAELDI